MLPSTWEWRWDKKKKTHHERWLKIEWIVSCEALIYMYKPIDVVNYSLKHSSKYIQILWNFWIISAQVVFILLWVVFVYLFVLGFFGISWFESSSSISYVCQYSLVVYTLYRFMLIFPHRLWVCLTMSMAYSHVIMLVISDTNMFKNVCVGDWGGRSVKDEAVFTVDIWAQSHCVPYCVAPSYLLLIGFIPIVSPSSSMKVVICYW